MGVNEATGAVSGIPKRKRVQGTWTRPADTTAYAAGDVLAPATGGGMVALANCANFNGGSGKITDVVIECNLATVTLGTFRVHFFNATHTTAVDNAAFITFHANAAAYQGTCDTTILVADNASAVAAVARNSGKIQTAEATLPIPFVCAANDDNLYAVVLATAAYVPSSGEVFRLSIIVEPDA